MFQLKNAPNYDKQSASGSLEVCDVTYTNVRENWIHRERFLSTDEMIYLAKGELYLSVNDREYAVRRRSFLFLRRFSKLAGSRTSDTPCEFYTVAYNGEQIVPYSLAFCEIPLSGSSIFREELLKRLLDAKRFGEIDPNEMNGLFLALTLEAKRALESGTSVVPLMERAIRIIDENIHSIVTVDEVSERLGYNRDYISKLFLSCYGITIKNTSTRKSSRPRKTCSSPRKCPSSRSPTPSASTTRSISTNSSAITKSSPRASSARSMRERRGHKDQSPA